MADARPPQVVADNRSHLSIFVWLVVVQGPGSSKPLPGTLFRLRGGDTIGRNAGNDIVLADAAVSDHHAQVFVRDVPDRIEIVLRDVGSVNGICVNGVKGAEHVLGDGDHVELGQTHLIFRQVRR